jgi:hypothetical protein
MNNNEFASSLAALFIEKQPSPECKKDLLGAMCSGALSFTWNGPKGSLVMNCETNQLATSLIWAHMDDSFAAAGRALRLELLEIHAMDTGVTYDLCHRMMNTKLC